MVSKIADMIKIEHNRHLTQSQAAPMDLIFTGHSAGGAVAALLFTHMMHGSREDYPIKDLTQLRDGISPSLTPLLPTHKHLTNLLPNQNSETPTASPLPPRPSPPQPSTRPPGAKPSSSPSSTKVIPCREQTKLTCSGLSASTCKLEIILARHQLGCGKMPGSHCS